MVHYKIYLHKQIHFTHYRYRNTTLYIIAHYVTRSRARDARRGPSCSCPTLLSVPSKELRLVRRPVMAVTALPTRLMITSPSFCSTCNNPEGKNCMLSPLLSRITYRRRQALTGAGGRLRVVRGLLVPGDHLVPQHGAQQRLDFEWRMHQTPAHGVLDNYYEDVWRM